VDYFLLLKYTLLAPPGCFVLPLISAVLEKGFTGFYKYSFVDTLCFSGAGTTLFSFWFTV